MCPVSQSVSQSETQKQTNKTHFVWWKKGPLTSRLQQAYPSCRYLSPKRFPLVKNKKHARKGKRETNEALVRRPTPVFSTDKAKQSEVKQGGLTTLFLIFTKSRMGSVKVPSMSKMTPRTLLLTPTSFFKPCMVARLSLPLALVAFSQRVGCWLVSFLPSTLASLGQGATRFATHYRQSFPSFQSSPNQISQDLFNWWLAFHQRFHVQETHEIYKRRKLVRVEKRENQTEREREREGDMGLHKQADVELMSCYFIFIRKEEHTRK